MKDTTSFGKTNLTAKIFIYFISFLKFLRYLKKKIDLKDEFDKLDTNKLANF